MMEDKLSRNEARFTLQKELLKKHNTSLLTCSLRLPGNLQDSPEAGALFSLAWETVRKNIPPQKWLECSREEKNWRVVAVAEEALTLKKMALEWENQSEAGIFWDLDVISPDHTTLSRQSLKFPFRSCVVCGENAKICLKQSSHSPKEITEAFHLTLENYFLGGYLNRKAREVAEKATSAALLEVSAHPKPGLVSPFSRGAHKDMDWGSFVFSSISLGEVLACFFRAGENQKDPQKLLRNIRAIGACGERKMYRATQGVNTQKGFIFIMGLIISTLGAVGLNVSTEEIRRYVQQMARIIVTEDFARLKSMDRPLTSGEKAFAEYQAKGVRGEAEKGFPLVFDVGKPTIEEAISGGLSINHSLLQGLLAIMAQAEDTTMIKRGNLEGLYYAQKKASKILSRGGLYSPEGYQDLQELHDDFSSKQLSVGGAADLLAASLFFILLEENHSRFFYS